ncbi:MAG TPA: ATP-binding protein [Pirellulales bacterium]|nr:ATP-binding protein [Pirellulales bacterium]
MVPKLANLRLPVWLHAALVGLLFLASVFTLAYGAWTVRPTREIERSTQERLRQASSRMAAAATTLVDRSKPKKTKDLELQGRTLSEIAERVLRDFDGVEGGFYLNGKGDRFSGYAFPTGRPRPPRRQKRDEPPPLEEPYIRIQARQSLSLPAGEESISIHDIGPSRVMILTEPIGGRRPAPAATWLMYRLVDPRSLDRQVQRYRASSGLALGGLFLAMLLMAGLARNLKRQQREQARLRDELRRSERLASLGTLLAGVAHEVRNPLAAIRSTVQLWQRLPDRSRTPESLEAVIGAVDRLNDTVSQLLYFSRADGTQREPVDVNLLLRETLELFAAQANSQQVALKADLSDDVGTIPASPAALRQVFANLTRNALQAMPDGGQLQVSARRGETGACVAIDFADNGPGIPPEVRSHLFEPFFTTRPDGTGLGLALCREIIVQHEGTIEYIDSQAGARFRIELPR